MESSQHTMSNLFAQLGLPSEPDDIRSFIERHRPLAPDVRLHRAPFWSPSQAAFLREEIAEDADWAEVVDQLDGELRAAN
ncbi:MAG TPA: DUF2789 domain-containing protein [Rhodocyclaceae bacterium]